jgi:hypothetical protein
MTLLKRRWLEDWDATNTYYVGKHGSDSYSGKSPEKAKLTIASALTASSNGDKIEIIDEGNYSEDPDFSNRHLMAPSATITGKITIGPNTYIESLHKVTADPSGLALEWPSELLNDGTAYVNIDFIYHTAANSNGIEININDSNFYLNFVEIHAGDSGISFKSTSSSVSNLKGHIMTANTFSTAIAFNTRSSSRTYIDCQALFSGLGTCFLMIDTSKVWANVSNINATTLYNVGSSAQLWLQSHITAGTRTGAAELTLVDSAQRFFAVDANGGTNISAGWTNVPLNGVYFKNRIYTHSVVTNNYEITINDTGIFEVEAHIGVDVSAGSSRSVSQGKIQYDSGGGYADIGGTLSVGYNRLANRGYSEHVCKGYLYAASSGYKVKAQARRSAGTDTLVLVAYATRFFIRKLRENA